MTKHPLSSGVWPIFVVNYFGKISQLWFLKARQSPTDLQPWKFFEISIICLGYFRYYTFFQIIDPNSIFVSPHISTILTRKITKKVYRTQSIFFWAISASILLRPLEVFRICKISCEVSRWWFKWSSEMDMSYLILGMSSLLAELLLFCAVFTLSDSRFDFIAIWRIEKYEIANN